MSILSDIARVKIRISGEYDIRKAKLYALSLEYAGLAVNKARAEKKWTDQSFQAVDSMFARAFVGRNSIGFFLSHGKSYGYYLETANDRKYEIIRPVIEDLKDQYLKDAKGLW